MRIPVYTSDGSSPLVRGQPLSSQNLRGRLRIIPARAGPTFRLSWCLVSVPDHPRSCGANEVIHERLSQLIGSSPLVRGQRDRHRILVVPVRIIPARAGPTLTRRNSPTSSPDHPRSCGAKQHPLMHASLDGGSSPLVRGQLEQLRDMLSRVRIIPARAGPTTASVVVDNVASDHPRSCGANRCIFKSVSASSGSSPLVRGQHDDNTQSEENLRIIPARAGPTV